jgi:hypothetical protein
LDIAAPSRTVAHVPQQDGAPVAELRHELPELMTCIHHGDGVRFGKHFVSRKYLGQRIRGHAIDVESEFRGQRGIEFNQPWARNPRRFDAGVEMRRQACVGVGKQHVPMLPAIEAYRVDRRDKAVSLCQHPLT